MRPITCATTAFFLFAWASSPAHADPGGAAERACLDDAARYHHVSPRLLEAIVTVESGGNAWAINRNANGTADIGLMQINTTWLAALSRHGISRQALFEPCVNLYVGAWVLSRNFAQLGFTWNAIGAYNAQNPTKRIAYARKVYAALRPASARTQTVAHVVASAVTPRRERNAGSSEPVSLVAWEAQP
ncbi:lytic transglycosylase domain-containing protein [Trinickia symbiotica]|uniref:lytic transglycosylase domain-containing protein n=1 Tax=Trinickia symbiotica TaxID=863227 RepID=UPI000382AE06